MKGNFHAVTTRCENSVVGASSKRKVKARKTRRRSTFTAGSAAVGPSGSSSGPHADGELPVEIYASNRAPRNIRAGVLSLLMGSIRMSELFELVERPQQFPQILEVSEDRFELEQWTRNFIVGGLDDTDMQWLGMEARFLSEDLHLLQIKKNRYAVAAPPKDGHEQDASVKDEEPIVTFLKTMVHPTKAVMIARKLASDEIYSYDQLFRSIDFENDNKILGKDYTDGLLSEVDGLLPSEKQRIRDTLAKGAQSAMLYASRVKFCLVLVPLQQPSQFGLSASEGLTLQSKMFQAIIDVISSKRRGRLDRVIIENCISDYIAEFVNDRDLLSELQQSNPDERSVEMLTSSTIIQVALKFLYEQGAQQYYVVETLVFLILLVTYFLLVAHQVQDKVYREAAPELWVAASASLSVLWVREVVLLVCLRRQDLQNAFKGKKLHHRSWLDQVRRRPIPLPPGYTRNAFNWFNLAMLIVVGQTLWGRTPSSRNLVALGVFLVWVRLLSLLKDTSQMFSTFVLMTLQVAQSLGTFVTLLFIFLMGFAHAFHLLYRNTCVTLISGVHATRTHLVDGEECDEASLSDDGSVHLSVWATYVSSLWHVGLMAVGEFGAMIRSFPPHADPDGTDGLGNLTDLSTFNPSELWLWFFLMLIPIVLMNILIAIVSDSYDSAMARSERLYWLARLTLIADAGLLTPHFLQQSSKSKSALRLEIKRELLQNLIGHRKRWQGRVLDTFLRISKDSDFKTKHLQLELQKSSEQLREEVLELDTTMNQKMAGLQSDLASIKSTLHTLVREVKASKEGAAGGIGGGGSNAENRRHTLTEGEQKQRFMRQRRRSGIQVRGVAGSKGARRSSVQQGDRPFSNMSLLQQQQQQQQQQGGGRGSSRRPSTSSSSSSASSTSAQRVSLL